MFGFDDGGKRNGHDMGAALAMARQSERPAPASTDPLERFAEFAADVRERLDDGRTTYGDKSFAAKPEALAREIQHELLDVCGWAFVMWTRLEAIRAEAQRLAFSAPVEPIRLGAVAAEGDEE